MKKKVVRRRVRFELDGEAGNNVFVAGTFNSWNPKKNPMKFKQGKYSGYVLVPKGRHEYKFVVDENWCVDPECEDWVPNDRGSLNSVMIVD